MIGDGMGSNQVNMAHDYSGTNLNMENFPYKGTSETSNNTGGVTDSAAGGTALACGIKTANKKIGMDPSGNSKENIREFLVQRGKKSGLVSTVSITDATPAAFGAHNENRSNQAAIAEEFVSREIDVIMGGGGNNFGTALRNTAQNQKGYTIVTQKSALASFNGNTKLLALFQSGDFPYFSHGYSSAIPRLYEMTEKAVEILNQGENGFFLMVEGGRIDHAGHSNLKNENIFEVIEFDLAVKIAMDFAEENKDTLVIVTADHETGALTKEGSGYKFKSDNHSDAPVPVLPWVPERRTLPETWSIPIFLTE